MEFIGTFFLVLTVGVTVLGGVEGVIPPLAIGAALMAMLYAGGHISGAHYNPAVTLGAFVRGKFSTKDLALYIGAQAAAGAAAAYTAVWLVGKSGTPLQIDNAPVSFVAELLFTFALVFTVLNVATAKGTANNQYFGVAIAVVVVAGAFAVGPVSGGAFNPAVVLGLAIMKLLDLGVIWIHLSANFLGGILAALAFRAVNPADDR